MKSVPYRHLLGSQMFLSRRTRPDIATAVSMFTKFQSDPRPEHFIAMKLLLPYLKGSLNYAVLWLDDGDCPGIEAYP